MASGNGLCLNCLTGSPITSYFWHRLYRATCTIDSANPILLVALSMGAIKFWLAQDVILLVYQVELNVLVPGVIGKEMRLHPVNILFFTLATAKLFGLLGVFLAVPAAALVQIVTDEFYWSGCGLCFASKGFKEPAKQAFSAVQTFAAEIGHFAERLINGTRPVHSAEEGRDVLEVVLKAAESADGWQVCAAKKFQIREEKPQEHHFAFCVSMVIVNLTKKTKNIRFI